MSHSLWLYFLLVLGIVALPGMDMAYVVSSAWAGGARAAAAAIAGIVAGGIVHVATAALGISALLAEYPGKLRLFGLLGAGYMAWIGWQFLRTRPANAAPASSPVPKFGSVFRYGTMTCLVNPKAYAFTLAVLPSFLHSAGEPLALRVAALSGITASTQIAVYGTIAFTALRLHRRLGPSPSSRAWMQRAVGVFMMASAAVLACSWL